jgi:hypothetical protein
MDRDTQQQHLFAAAVRHADLTMEQLWMRYFALGGSAGLVEVEKYLNGRATLPPLQRDMLALAVNERLDELSWQQRVPYTRTVRESRPRGRPLAALLELLEGARLAPPERLAEAAAGAGRLLGVRISMYLVDYDQRALHPVGTDGGEREPLGVDTTLPGRAFRLVQTLSSGTDGSSRLWVPLLDGVERLGVLEVVPAEPADLHDPGLRAQCQWLSALLGHLVVTVTQYGDGLDAVRRRQPRTPVAELIWELLPPLTAGTDAVVLAGMLEPCYQVGGDAFDYSLSETTASLAVFDATGHAVSSGIVAAAALAAHRAARHAGHGLYEQAKAMDETITGRFDAGCSVTGLLMELDLSTGRLRYLNAGHPDPLVLRSGKVVSSLNGGRRVPFGLGAGELTIAEEMLEPDDWLVLHTDGIPAARDGDGNSFGHARLVDFLEREAAADHPPPETVRRLVQAVLAHQHGVLQDDATVLLVHWTGRAVPGSPGPRLGTPSVGMHDA